MAKVDGRRKVPTNIQKDALEIVGLADPKSLLACLDKVETMLFYRWQGERNVSRIARSVGAHNNSLYKLLNKAEEEYRAHVEDGTDDTACSLFFAAWEKYQARAVADALVDFNRTCKGSDDWRAKAARLKTLAPEDFNYDPSGANTRSNVNVFLLQKIEQISGLPTEQLRQLMHEAAKMLPKPDDDDVIEGELIREAGG